MTTLNTQQFDWDKQTRVLSTEMSTLDMGGTREVFCQIFNDSCDSGFTLCSHKTGRCVRMYVEHTQKDAYHDVQWWTLKPYAPDLRRGQIPNFSITIFND